MNKDQFDREVRYGTAIVIWKEMLKAGIIDKQDFNRIDKLYIKRYRPLFPITPHGKTEVERQP